MARQTNGLIGYRDLFLNQLDLEVTKACILAYYGSYLSIQGENICSPFADCIDLESEKEEYEFEKSDLTLADARLTGDEINIEGVSLELFLVFLTENQN